MTEIVSIEINGLEDFTKAVSKLVEAGNVFAQKAQPKETAEQAKETATPDSAEKAKANAEAKERDRELKKLLAAFNRQEQRYMTDSEKAERRLRDLQLYERKLKSYLTGEQQFRLQREMSETREKIFQSRFPYIKEDKKFSSEMQKILRQNEVLERQKDRERKRQEKVDAEKKSPSLTEVTGGALKES